MQSASLQRHACALPLPARASDTTLRLLVRLVACPLPAVRGEAVQNYRSAATAFTTFCTLLRCFDTLPLPDLYSLVLVG